MTPEQFLQVANSFPDAALLLTKDGKVVAVNRSTASLGLLAPDAAGSALSELTASPAEVVRDYLRRCSGSREPVAGTLAFRTRAGEERPCQCYGSTVPRNAQVPEERILLRLVCQDAPADPVTALNQKIDELTREVERRKQAEAELREAVARHRAMEEHLTALMQASTLLTRTLEAPVVLATILQLAEQLLPSDAYAVWRFHAGLGTWQIASSSGLSAAYQQGLVRVLEQTPGMPEKPVAAEDVFALPMLAERKEAYRKEGIRALLAMPLRIHGQVCGTLVFYHRQPHAYSKVEVRLATAAANLSAAAIGAADLYEAQARLRTEAQASKEQLRVMLASIGDAVIATDVKSRVTFLNPAAQALTGWTPKAAEGQPLETVFPIVNENTRQPAENPVVKAFREGTIVGLANHTLLIARDGTERPIADSAAPIQDERGEITGVVLVFRDVTAERRAEEERSRLASIVESSDDAIFSKTLDGIITSWNRAAQRLYGYTAEEIIGQSVALLIPSDRGNELADIMARLRRKERIGHFETVRQRKDGTLLDVSVSISPVTDAAGQVMAASTIARNVSHQKQAERTLRENEERLRLALEAGRMGTWDWHIPKSTVTWSPGLEALHGLAPGTFSGTFAAYQQDIHPEDREQVLRSLKETVAQGQQHHLEYRIIWPDGSVHWIEARGKLFRDEHGQPLRMLGVCMDIDARKRAEQTTHFLTDASAALAGLVDYESTLQKIARLAVPTFADWCAVDMLDEPGTLRRLAVAHVDPTKVQLAHELHRRYPADPNAPQGVWNILRTGKSEMISEITDEFIAATVKDAELLGILRELGLRSYMGVPLSVRGKMLGVITFIAAESGRHYDHADLAVAEDLAHRAAVAVENSRLYQAAREADRRKDEFLALLGHELRNPLAPIRNALYILKLPGADAAIAERARAMMERQLEHMARLVDDLLDVARIMRGKIQLRREPIELAVVVARAVETSQPAIDAEGHQLTVTLQPEPLWVNGDLVRLAQVITNLLNNAAKYTERGGQIWLSASREGEEAVLRVRDTGVGIAPDLLPRLFDMFFQAERRTKEAQGGLGIGLSLVRGLVELHDGKVEAHSAGPGKGSEFVVRLPVLHRDEDRGNATSSTERLFENKPAPRRLLVVDDNVDAADSLAMLLRLQGQEVEVAYDAFSALEKARAAPPAIALLDLGMPKMDGCELAQAFRKDSRLRNTVLVAVTGLGQPEDRQRTKEAGFDYHLVKPVEVNALHELLLKR